jgi:hypothetical protein
MNRKTVVFRSAHKTLELMRLERLQLILDPDLAERVETFATFVKIRGRE